MLYHPISLPRAHASKKGRVTTCVLGYIASGIVGGGGGGVFATFPFKRLTWLNNVVLQSTYHTLRNNEIQGGGGGNTTTIHTWRKTNRTDYYNRNLLNWIKQLFSLVRSTFLNKRSCISIE